MNKNKNTSMLHWNGTSQKERLLSALKPESIKVDERSVSDMLAFASKYSEMVKYYDQNNSHVGDWSNFFQNDLTVFLATIVSTDLTKIERQHNKLIHALENSPRAEEKLEALEGLMEQIMDMAHQLNSWYVHALEMDKMDIFESSELETELEESIKQQLAHYLMDLLEYQEDLGFNREGEYSRERIEEAFHPMWFREHKRLGEKFIDLKDSQASDRIKDYTKKVRIQFRTFYSVTSYVVQISSDLFEDSMLMKSDHKPDVALFISFLQMFKKLQKEANTVTAKHLDFYYFNVLKQRQRGLVPDQANIYFETARHTDTHYLEAGTLLTAGVDSEGVEQLYTTNRPIEINKTKIGALKTIFVAKNTKIGIGSSYRVVTNLYAADAANSLDGKGERFINNEENWPTFGHDILELSKSQQQMQFADLGWAISAPILELEEGHRVVTMRFTFSPTSMYTLNLLIKDISKNEKISREDAFSKIFKNSLEVHFTTTEGWTEAYTAEVLPPLEWGKPEITIVASLTNTAPSVVGYNPKTMGGGYDTPFPIVKILQRSEGAFYTYSFLKDLELKTVNLDVNVTGMKRLNVSNNLGGLDASVPFQPFGPIPQVGSFMMVGKEELFRKELTDVRFNVEWHNLPDDKKGLRGYYKEYGLGIKNEDYRFRMSALSGGYFYPVEGNNVLEYPLYESDPENSLGIHRRRNLGNINLDALNIKPDHKFTMPSVYNNEAQAGFFKFELTAPKYAFGHAEYASLYARAVAYNSDPNRKGVEKPLPNSPYTPVVRTLTMDYSATAEVAVLSLGKMNKGKETKEQLYHIHPFGNIRTYHHGRSTNLSLLPNYTDDAYLYIGLKDFRPPNPLSIYFELKENMNLFTDAEAKKGKPEIFWSYMVNDEWRTFSQNQILSDTTNGFINSGIIELEVPRDLTDDNQTLPQDMHWLCVTVRGAAQNMPRTLKVATQAVSVTWVDNGSGERHLEQALPAKQIKKLASSISQVRAVHQPFPSFGGRVGEDKLAFYTRTSERLRHKNRAVSAWDYERLILERFNNIHQVKCITHLGHEEHVPAGTVTIVVVPKLDSKMVGYHLPMVNQTILLEIKEYLQSLASPFVNIEVRNPIYERVKVTAGVRFQKGKNNGTFLKKLNQDIIKFMSPWMVGEEQELELGGSLIKDSILSYIEKKDYVDFVTKFSVVQVFPEDRGFDVDDTAIHATNSPLITATKPWSILIPFEMNPLYFLEDDTFQMAEKASISSMIIDGDFVMTEEKERDYEDYMSTKRRKKDEEDDQD